VRLALACALFAALSGCDLFYPLDGYEARERDADTGAVRLMQRAEALASDTRELTVTLPSPPASGSTLVLVAASTHTLPISVTGSSNWTKVTSSSVHIALAIWTTVVPAGTSGAVKATWPAGPADAQATALLHLGEWTGLAAPGPALVNDGTGGGPIVTRTLSTGDRTGLVLAAAGAHGTPLGPPPQEFTPIPTLARTDTQLALAYVVSPPAGTYGSSWSFSSSDGWEAHIASFTRAE
jgi:hypothetical protein